MRATLVPVATFFARLPKMWPLVRETLPLLEIESVFAPVVMVPFVSVNVPLTVRFAPSVTPPELLIVRLCKTEVDDGNS